MKKRVNNILVDLSINDTLTTLQSNIKQHIPHDLYKQLRGSMNKMECLGKGVRENPFINRSAMKLVEIDYTMNLIHPQSDHLSYLDVCGGPGGFVEYIMNKCCRHHIGSSGYGITLTINPSSLSSSDSCNWNIQQLHQPPYIHIATESMIPHEKSLCLFTIINGPTSNGDVYMKSNRDHLSSYILKQHPSGVQIVFADGGFEVENNAEESLLRLVWCEVTTMVGTLATNCGGIFVLKMMSSHEEGSSKLILFLCSLFTAVSILKPLTSRPSSSERYIVCKNLALLSGRDKEEILAIIESIIESLATGNDVSYDALDELVERRIRYEERVCVEEKLRAANNTLALLQVECLARIIDAAIDKLDDDAEGRNALIRLIGDITHIRPTMDLGDSFSGEVFELRGNGKEEEDGIKRRRISFPSCGKHRRRVMASEFYTEWGLIV